MTTLLRPDEIERYLPEAVANVMLAGSSNPLQGIINSTLGTRNAVSKGVGDMAEEASKAWIAAGQESVDFITLVVENNIHRPMSEILARPDIQDALTYPYEQAGAKTKQLVQSAWDSGSDIGVTAAVKDLGKMGYKAGSGVAGLYDNSILDSILSDVDANVSRITERLTAALAESALDKMPGIVKEFAWRNFLSVQEAGSFATNQAKEEALNQAALEEGISLKKMWVTRFGPGTCNVCAMLHGTVRAFGQAFPDSGELKVYGDILNNPPRHPNCRCIIVPWIDTMTGTPNPKTLKAFASKWLKGES